MFWISAAFWHPPGNQRGGTYTWAAWWLAEPTRDALRPPDAMGRGRDAKDALEKAERAARAAGAEGDAIKRGPAWAKAARAQRLGEPMWPKDHAAIREARDRTYAEHFDELSRISVLAFTRNGERWKGFLFVPAGSDECVVYALVGVKGGKVRAKARANGELFDREVHPETIALDAAELERDGRAWCRAYGGFVYAHPTTWPAWKTWQAKREPGKFGRGPASGREARRLARPHPGRAELARFGLSVEATPATVRRVFRKMVAALGLHPDQGGDAEAFKELSKACDLAVAFVEGR